MPDNPLLLLSLAVAPAVFLLLFVYLRDKYEHEPLGLVGITFIFGALGIIPATVIELLLDMMYPAGVFVGFFLHVALVEELIKFLAVRVKAYDSPHFREVMDGIVYAVAAGLGFATVENVLYVFESGLSVAIVRAFLAVPNHAVWAGIMGFYIGFARCKSATPSQERWQIIKGVGLAIIMHGLYDVSVNFSSLLGIVGVSLAGWVIFLWMIGKALSLSPFRWRGAVFTPSAGGAPWVPLAPRFCTQCGNALVGEERFCMNCGAEVRR
jgi:RsiW-degrading membrane proteinase PrsW (M82 family)